MPDLTPKIEDSLTYKVAKDNALIQRAQTDLTRNEQKLVNYMISLVSPSDEDFKTYKISISDFAKIAGLNAENLYRDFKRIINDIDKKSFWFENDELLAHIHWIVTPVYVKKTGYVEIRLDPQIKKYLIGLKKNFTEYELFNIMSLKSKYAITIYELLKSYEYKKVLEIDVDELKNHLSANTESYKLFGMFRARILDKAIDDINLNTDLDISYKCLDASKKVMKSTRGKKIYYLRFSIKAKELMDTFEVYTRTKDRINIEPPSDQVPHQISLDTDNETDALFDDTTNQRIN